MDSKYNWNLKEIFENEDALENSIKDLYGLIEKIKTYEGRLSESVSVIYEYFKVLEKALELHERIYAYSMFKYHQDMSSQDAIKLYKRVEKITTDFSEAESFASPEISKIDDSKLEEYLQDERMKEFEKSIRDIMKDKKHILSEEVEKVLAQYGEIFSASENTFDIFTNTEFEFENIYDDNGNELKMNAALYSKYLTDKSENVRRQAFESMYKLYKKHINTITELYLTRVKSRVISSRLRKFNSSLDSATNADDSNEAVYHTLLDAVNKNLYLNHEYLKLKAKLLGKEKLEMYDVYLNTLETENTHIEYEDAKNTVLDALSILGQEYTDKLREAFDNNWLDVYEKDNKMGGAYSMGVHTLHPFVLLNYINSSRDVSTIAHELGHSMHSYYASKNQNIINANYTIMVAEVASTVNELLLANYLINKEQDTNKKLL